MQSYFLLYALSILTILTLKSEESEQLNTPVLLLIFKRPEHQQKVFEQIRQARPKQLFIAADGPRKNVPDDAIKCTQARKVIEQIDWPCEVRTLFRDQNLGCGQAVSSAISWMFNHVDEGIILEDDCMPNQSFFQFCQKMLNFYRNDPQIMHVGGNTSHVTLEKSYDPSEPYSFTHFMNCWGWATWKRAWVFYDHSMNYLNSPKGYSDLTQKMTQLLCQDNANLVRPHVSLAKRGMNIWAIRWFVAITLQNGWCISPQVNLVENVGFDGEGTHTTGIYKMPPAVYLNCNSFERLAPPLQY